MKFSKDFKEIKGDASIRKFYRNSKKNSIIVFANIEKIKNLDLFDKNENTITLIEWPELINKGNFKKTIDLIFNYENELNNRSIKIDGLD